MADLSLMSNLSSDKLVFQEEGASSIQEIKSRLSDL